MVVAHELKAYSDTIAAAVGVLRPHVSVTTVTPAEVELVASTITPRVVLTSRAPLAIPPPVLTWIELYPGGSNHAVIHRSAGQTLIPDIDFDTLMALLDESLPPPVPTPVIPTNSAA